MSFNPKKITVLGAGIMGAQIAAAFASIGRDVWLLDLPGNDTSKNELSEKGVARVRSMSPPPFYRVEDLNRIRCGNFRDHLGQLSNSDLVIEAVVENPSIKASIFEQIAPHLGDRTKVGTNTSGILIQQLEKVIPQSMKPHFIGGVHFFNPTRLPLLELIFAPHVGAEERSDIAEFFRDKMGKQVVQAHDRPGFAANRVGMYAMMLAIEALERGDFTIPELEVLTGPLVGRSRSATFRTADIVGLGTFLNVTRYLKATLTDDPENGIFQAPRFVEELASRNGKFSFKDRSKDVILSLDPATGEYKPLTAEGLGELPSPKKIPYPADRIAALMERTDRVGEFVRDFNLRFLNYCAWRVREVAESPRDIDVALRAGFAWELGPFELWNHLGVAKVAEMMTQAGLTLPDWVSDCVSRTQDIPTLRRASSSSSVVMSGLTGPDSAVSLLGDGVLQFNLTGTGRTLSSDVIDSLNRALDTLESPRYVGMIIGDGSGDTFCAGANLKQIGAAIQAGDFVGINGVLDRLQQVFDRLYSADKPVVGALSGKALGGGAELLIALPKVIASPESYVGLVEMGVGVIPAGCGTTHFAQLASERAGAKTVADAVKVMPFLREAFLRIATGSVTSSAYQALDAGFLSPSSRIEMRSDRLLQVAKEEILLFSDSDYTARSPRSPFLVLGANGRAILEAGVESFLHAGQISEYDAYLARRLAWVMTGGDLSDAAFVSPHYLYALERQVFVELVKNAGTHQKMARFAKAG